MDGTAEGYVVGLSVGVKGSVDTLKLLDNDGSDNDTGEEVELTNLIEAETKFSDEVTPELLPENLINEALL